MTGVLLINLGTPDAPTAADVRRYLREFLSDPRVVDLPPLGRALLLNLVILPFRPRLSAEAYRQIWTDEGSPLLLYSRDLAGKVAERLGPGNPVELAMRYGNPSIAAGLRRLTERGVSRIRVLPLYPQEASATTGSTLEKVYREAGKLARVPELEAVGSFYGHPAFLRAWKQVARPALESFRPDHVLVSYHGLPERQIRKADPGGRWCLVQETCCDALTDRNRHCYRAQCFATTRYLAEAIDLPIGHTTTTFQSRLGRTPWIRPYTDETLAQLPGRGVKRLAVLSPAFVADCLETLEEIGIRGRETFLAAGGEDFLLVPSLNATPAWVDAVAEILAEAGPLSPARKETS
jgi:ferrochelatase